MHSYNVCNDNDTGNHACSVDEKAVSSV